MTLELTREDIGRGLEALFRALGPDKSRVFLDLVASGALDPSLLNRAQAFVRRNPEVIQAGASLVGGFLAAVLASQNAKKKDPRRALKLLQEGLGMLAQPHSIAVREQVAQAAATPDTVIDVEFEDP